MIVTQARQPAFYLHCGVPDTPIGRFDMIALHAFLVMHRLKREPEAFELSRALAEAMVTEIDRGVRELGTGDLSVGKKVKHMTRGFYGRIMAYEEGLARGEVALASALRRNLYAAASPGEEEVAAMVAYIRREAASLAEQPVAAMQNGEVRFGPPPTEGR